MITELTFNNFDTEINREEPVVLEFYTSTCTHCKKLAKILDKLSDEITGTFFAKYNIENETTISGRYDISAVPALFFIKNGEVKNKLVGEVHPLIIQEEIKKLL